VMARVFTMVIAIPFLRLRDGTHPLAAGPVNPGLLHRTGRSGRYAGGCRINLGPADESLAGQPERASADSQVRPGPRLPTLRPYSVKTGEARPEALSTSSLPNLAPFARRGRATGQRTYCPCSVCSEPEAHPLQAVRGLAAALSHANATGNPGGLRFARRLGRSPLDGHCGPAAPRQLHPPGRRTQVLTVFRLPTGGAVRQGSRSSRSRRAGTGHYLPQPSSHRFHLAKADLLPGGIPGRRLGSRNDPPPRPAGTSR
jgi:hypothetical protein